MMSLRLKRAMSLMIAVFVAFGMMAVSTGEVNAASGKVKVEINNQIEKTNHIYAGEQTYVTVYNTKQKKVKIKSVKVSDKSIAKVKVKTLKYAGKKNKEYYVVGKQPGKTKVSVKYKCNGKAGTKKVTVTVVPYPNPLASLEVNGKNVPLSGDTGFLYEKKCKKTKVNIKAVAAEGWEITSADSRSVYGTAKNPKFKDTGVKSKIKNGKTISFPKKHKALYTSINLENDEGVVVFYEIVLKR